MYIYIFYLHLVEVHFQVGTMWMTSSLLTIYCILGRQDWTVEPLEMGMEEIDPVQQVSSVQSPGWLMIIVVKNWILTMHIWG